MNLKIHSSQPLRAALDGAVVDAVGQVFNENEATVKGLSGIEQNKHETTRKLYVRDGYTYEVSVKVIAWPGMHMREVKVYRNISEDADGGLMIFRRFPSEDHYQEGDTLELAYEFEYVLLDRDDPYLPVSEDFEAYQIAVDERACEAAFAKCNHGSPIEVDNYRGRSLSVGDVVEVDGRRYACEPVGWKLITEMAAV